MSHEESDVRPVAHERAVFQKSNQGSPNDDEKLWEGRKGGRAGDGSWIAS